MDQEKKEPTLSRPVHPRWWTDARRAQSILKRDSARILGLMERLEADELDVNTAELLQGHSARFADTADKLGEEFAAIADGSSKFLVDSTGSDDPGDPGQRLDDLEELALKLQTGVVIDGDLLIERLIDYGGDPDALPAALHALANRLEGIAPDKRPEARMVVLLNEMPQTSGRVGDVTSAAGLATAADAQVSE